MSIQILPARLANQIAAGEVVERPASVIKELVENSLDAGATKIHIEVEKGGAKKIRISDDGCGIVKDELGLALSRHATSKIKDLSDLEAIASLGFRGEALASISSVARLTLTSKPVDQENAWQAFAQGRDMEVTLKPAAHPDGTTIEVADLFFNTPARRKFLRTEKTEFNHIDEIIRRIALARFDVTFTLTHNGKMIRQYRAAKDQQQFQKRVAAVCGQKFVDNSIEVECQHDQLHLWGWIAKPSYTRPTNDLCYSYVNGRMMRDKLINHGIRQAYADLLPSDGYPAFVLFLELDFKEVDVNVHPAKHEVRFHQGRYVHDFIFSVCHQALQDSLQTQLAHEDVTDIHEHVPSGEDHIRTTQDGSVAFNRSVSEQLTPNHTGSQRSPERDYVKPLQFAQEPASQYQSQSTSHQANQSYQQLMTPYQVDPIDGAKSEYQALANMDSEGAQILHIVDDTFALIRVEQSLRILSLAKLAHKVALQSMIQRWQDGITSQPLLLPIILKLDNGQFVCAEKNAALLEKAGIVFVVQTREKIQIRQFPAILRDKDVNTCVTQVINALLIVNDDVTENDMINALTTLTLAEKYSIESAQQLLYRVKTLGLQQLNELINLNSVPLDLTSELLQLK